MPTTKELQRRFENTPYNQPMKTVEESIQFTLALMGGDTEMPLPWREVFVDERGKETLLWHVWKDETRRSRVIMDTPWSGHSVSHTWGADFYFDQRGRIIKRPFDRLGKEERIPPKLEAVKPHQLQGSQCSLLIRNLEIKRLEILLVANDILHRPLAEI